MKIFHDIEKWGTLAASVSNDHWDHLQTPMSSYTSPLEIQGQTGG